MSTKAVFVHCVISRGAFSGERVFEVKTADGHEYIGLAPQHYYRTAQGGALDPCTPGEGQTINGSVQAKLIENGGSAARVALPDGEAIEVPAGLVRYV